MGFSTSICGVLFLNFNQKGKFMSEKGKLIVKLMILLNKLFYNGEI